MLKFVPDLFFDIINKMALFLLITKLSNGLAISRAESIGGKNIISLFG